MDEYYLSKEDWDTIVELGVDDRRDDVVLKKITPATKTSLTRKWVQERDRSSPVIWLLLFRYNSREHPIPFHKAIDLGKPPKKLTGQQAPDLEEAYVSFVSPLLGIRWRNFYSRLMMTLRKHLKTSRRGRKILMIFQKILLLKRRRRGRLLRNSFIPFVPIPYIPFTSR